LEILEDRSLPAVSFTLGAMGDSLTAPYAGLRALQGGRSWAEQLSIFRADQVSIVNFAVPGATSSTLIAQGQDAAVARLVTGGAVHDVALFIGANDITSNGLSIFRGDTTSAVATVAANIEAVIDRVAAAGQVHLVIGNIFDVRVMPMFRAVLNSSQLQELTAATVLANQRIEAIAAACQIPVVDLFSISHLIFHPITMGGVQIADAFSADYMHPSAVGEGIFANAVLDAFAIGYHAPTSGLELSDQEILEGAQIAHTQGRSFFDVSPYVILGGPISSPVAPLDQNLHSAGSGIALIAAIPITQVGSFTQRTAGASGVEVRQAVDQIFAAVRHAQAAKAWDDFSFESGVS
jgi:lysophospholipase L1-like esterase